MFLTEVILARVDMRLLYVEVFGHEIFELPEAFAGNHCLCVIEINNLFEVGESSPKVEEVIFISIILFQGEVD